MDLFEQYAGDAIRYPESPLVLPYHLQEQSVGGKITLIGDLSANERVFLIVEIRMVIIEDRIVS
jgi:hypothetical protein